LSFVNKCRIDRFDYVRDCMAISCSRNKWSSPFCFVQSQHICVSILIDLLQILHRGIEYLNGESVGGLLEGVPCEKAVMCSDIFYQVLNTMYTCCLKKMSIGC